MKFNHTNLGAFAKFRRQLLASLCLSVRMKQLGPHWMDFYEIWYLNFFQKMSRKLKFYWNLTGITGTLYEEQYTLLIISFSVLLRMKICQTKVAANNKTHFIFNNFFRKMYRLWDYVEKYCRPGLTNMKIWRIYIACWIPKATNTHSEYVILIAFPLQQCLHESASMLQYKYLPALLYDAPLYT
jgi:hypothetical protein